MVKAVACFVELLTALDYPKQIPESVSIFLHTDAIHPTLIDFPDYNSHAVVWNSKFRAPASIF